MQYCTLESFSTYLLRMTRGAEMEICTSVASLPLVFLICSWLLPLVVWWRRVIVSGMEMLVALLRGEGARDRSQLGWLLRLGSPCGFATTLSGQEEDEADHVGERGDLKKVVSSYSLHCR